MSSRGGGASGRGGASSSRGGGASSTGGASSRGRTSKMDVSKQVVCGGRLKPAASGPFDCCSDARPSIWYPFTTLQQRHFEHWYTKTSTQ